jgi:type II secretory pathway pseudopilin PulG
MPVPWEAFRHIARRAAGEQGFSIIEVLASALVLAVLSSAVAMALIGNARFSQVERERSQANAIAQQDQERLKGLSAQQLSTLQSQGSQTRAVTLGNTTFSVQSTAQFLNSSGNTSCGSSSGGAAAYYNVGSKVTWGTSANNKVAESSLITPPVGGILLTQIADQTGAGMSGVNVAASGPDQAWANTDSSGCAVLSGLQPGNYNLTVTDNGYVDVNGNPSPLNLAATVAGTGPAPPSGGNPVVIGQPGAISATFQTAGTSTPQYADGFGWYGAGSNYQMPAPDSYGPVSPATQLPAGGGTQQLFPFAFTGPSYANNYSVWAGTCPQMQPPAASVTKASVGPGSNQTVALAEPALKVTVTYAGLFQQAKQVKPNDIRITFQSGDGSCTDTWSAPVNPNAATSGQNALAYPGQPYASNTSGPNAPGGTGTLSVCADYSPNGSTYYRGSATGVTNANFSSATSVPTIALTWSSTTGKCP